MVLKLSALQRYRLVIFACSKTYERKLIPEKAKIGG